MGANSFCGCKAQNNMQTKELEVAEMRRINPALNGRVDMGLLPQMSLGYGGEPSSRLWPARHSLGEVWRRGWDLNPRYLWWGTHALQACSLGRSDTSPQQGKNSAVFSSAKFKNRETYSPQISFFKGFLFVFAVIP